MISVLYSRTVLMWATCLRRCQNPRSNMQITVEIHGGNPWPLIKHLPWHGLTAQLYLKFLLVAQQQVPFTNTSEATKRSSNQTGNSKWTNVTNRQSREGLSTPFYTNPLQLQDTRFVFVRIFTVPHIYGLHYAWLPIEPISTHDQMWDRFTSSVWNFRR